MRAWLISKINRISPYGIARVTLTQDTFDQHRDYIERDDSGNIIGMWADYWSTPIEPTSVPVDDDTTPSSIITSRITCSGKPIIKIGGSAKTFTVTYYGEDGEPIDTMVSEGWNFSIDGVSVSNTLFDLTPEGNKIKVKFLGDDSYIGKILTISNISGEVTSSLEIEINAL